MMSLNTNFLLEGRRRASGELKIHGAGEAATAAKFQNRRCFARKSLKARSGYRFRTGNSLAVIDNFCLAKTGRYREPRSNCRQVAASAAIVAKEIPGPRRPFPSKPFFSR